MSSDDARQVKRSRVDLDVIVGAYPSVDAIRRASKRVPDHVIVSANPKAVAIDGLVVHLPASPFKMLVAIICRRGGLITRDDLIDYLYGDRIDGGPDHVVRIVDVFMQQVTAAALAIGIRIERDHGFGWRAFRASAPLQIAAE